MFVSPASWGSFLSSQRIQLSGEEKKKRYPPTETEINGNCTQLSVILGFFSVIFFFFLDKAQIPENFGMFPSVQQQKHTNGPSHRRSQALQPIQNTDLRVEFYT